jgi:hypothetical protein
MGNYSIDVDLATVQVVRAGLTQMSHRLDQHADTISRSPDELGAAWVGPAASAVKAEMVGLGAQCRRFAPHFTDAVSAVDAFVAVVHATQDVVAGLNRRFDAVHQQHADDLTRARYSAQYVAPESAGSVVHRAQVEANEELTRALHSVDVGYQEAVAELDAAARRLAAALRSATVVAVPDGTTSAYRHGPLTSETADDLHRAALAGLDGRLNLPQDRQDQADGARAAKDLTTLAAQGTGTPEQLQDFRSGLRVESPAFRQAFLAGLDPQALFVLQQTAHLGVSGDHARQTGAAVTAVARILALGSRAEAQGAYPVPDAGYADLRSAYRQDERPEEGHLLLAELVQAGQGAGATWSSPLLAGVAEDTIAFERETSAADPNWSWSQVYTSTPWPTAAGRRLYGDAPATADALAMVFDALGDDPVAAQEVLTGPGHRVDTDRLHWLYAGRAPQNTVLPQPDPSLVWGAGLGHALDAATTPVGPGQEGSATYASAAIAADFVHYYGTHPDELPASMARPTVNILTHHIQAVNYANGEHPTVVIDGHPDRPLEYERIARANLRPSDLAGLLKATFAQDYSARHSGDPEPGGRYPMYQQLAAAQHAAFRRDFLAATDDPVSDEVTRLRAVVQQQTFAENGLALALRDSLINAGAADDQANADARAAVDLMLGLGIDRLPIDRLGGPAGAVVGLGIDDIRREAVDGLVPQTHRAATADHQGVNVQVYLRQVTPLGVLGSLDQAGLLKGNETPASWVASHPGSSSFIVDGHFIDLADLYAHRAERVKQWNDFEYYYHPDGEDALIRLDLTDSINLGFLTSDDEHGGYGG